LFNSSVNGNHKQPNKIHLPTFRFSIHKHTNSHSLAKSDMLHFYRVQLRHRQKEMVPQFASFCPSKVLVFGVCVLLLLLLLSTTFSYSFFFLLGRYSISFNVVYMSLDFRLLSSSKGPQESPEELLRSKV